MHSSNAHTTPEGSGSCAFAVSSFWFWPCLSACLFVTAAVQARPPCSGLSREASTQYGELLRAASEAYARSDFTTAAAYTRQAIAVCDEDPRNAFNLGRALHRIGLCEGLVWYERVLSDSRSASPVDLPELQSLARKHHAVLLQQCKTEPPPDFEPVGPSTPTTQSEVTPPKPNNPPLDPWVERDVRLRIAGTGVASLLTGPLDVARKTASQPAGLRLATQTWSAPSWHFVIGADLPVSARLRCGVEAMTAVDGRSFMARALVDTWVHEANAVLLDANFGLGYGHFRASLPESVKDVGARSARTDTHVPLGADVVLIRRQWAPFVEATLCAVPFVRGDSKSGINPYIGLSVRYAMARDLFLQTELRLGLQWQPSARGGGS